MSQSYNNIYSIRIPDKLMDNEYVQNIHICSKIFWDLLVWQLKKKKKRKYRKTDSLSRQPIITGIKPRSTGPYFIKFNYTLGKCDDGMFNSCKHSIYFLSVAKTVFQQIMHTRRERWNRSGPRIGYQIPLHLFIYAICMYGIYMYDIADATGVQIHMQMRRSKLNGN